MVKLRKATIADEKDVALIMRELLRTVGVIGDENPVEWNSSLRKMLSAPEWTFLLAENHGKIIGILVLFMVPSMQHGGNRGAITELYVRPEYQGKGYGKELVEEARRLCSSLGCSTLDVSVEVENEGAVGFYEKLGFKRKHADYSMKL